LRKPTVGPRRKQFAALLLLAFAVLLSACTRDAPPIDNRLITPAGATTPSSDTPAAPGLVTPAPTRIGTLNATAAAAGVPSAIPTLTPPTSTATAAPTAASAVNTPVAVPATPTRTITGRTLTVKAYFIARNDGGALGPKIGCGDSAVAVNRILPYTTSPLTAAMKELLSIHDEFYGQSGLYNALHSSRLQVSSVTLVGGVATIRLTGTTSLGGECDDPRFEAQLKLTALQFATVHVVNVFINAKPLNCVLGGKGC
jgi:spore germination protein GerM